jgi:hypothetical protein
MFCGLRLRVLLSHDMELASMAALHTGDIGFFGQQNAQVWRIGKRIFLMACMCIVDWVLIPTGFRFTTGQDQQGVPSSSSRQILQCTF